MNKTTGADATALSIADLTASDRHRRCPKFDEIRGRSDVYVADGAIAAAAPRSACQCKRMQPAVARHYLRAVV